MSDIHTPYGPLHPAQADELLHVPAQRLDRQILAHSRRWHTVGLFMRCTACGHSQKASESARPFPHDPACQANAGEEFPWQELAAILRHLPTQSPTNAPGQKGNHL